MSNLTQTQALNFLNTLKVIPNGADGKFKNIEVYHVGRVIDKDGRDKYIVNFRAITAYKQQIAVEAFNAGNYSVACGKTLSADILLDANGNTNKFVPSKGDVVDLIIQQIPVKDSETGETFSAVRNIIEVQGEELSTFSLNVASESEEEETLEEALKSAKK